MSLVPCHLYHVTCTMVNPELFERQMRMGASAKVLSTVKAICLSSSAVVTHATYDGVNRKSNVLAISRGVLQEDILSPLLFCVGLDLDCIFRDFDVHCEGIDVSTDQNIKACEVCES